MNGPSLDAHLVLHRSNGFVLDLAISIDAGTTVAILGPNGAGKSTAVSALAGLLALDDGHITLDGRDLDRPTAGRFVEPAERRVGVVFQDHLLFDHLTVAENVAFGLHPAGWSRARAARAARPWLDRFDLTDLADRTPTELSGGQAQRVAIARALAAEPDLLLLDEPLAAVDLANRTVLRRRLAEDLARYPGPRVLITHEPADAFALADQILILEEGRRAQLGTTAEIRRHPASPYAAAVAGTNLMFGHNDGRGVITVDPANGHHDPADAPITLQAADSRSGPVQLVIDPRAISLHPERPTGSHRNVWPTTVDWLEPLGDTTRIMLGAPLALVVDITPSAAAALGLRPGAPVWAALKATEISTSPRVPAD